MTTIRDLSWRQARYYADLGYRIRRLGWPVQTVMGFAETRWLLRPRAGTRRGALFYTQIARADGLQQSYVARNLDMREADFRASDWMVEIPDDPPPPPPPPDDPFPDPPVPPARNCEDICPPPMLWGGGGDTHFFLNGGSIVPGGPFGAAFAWDDNVDDPDEILYVGAQADAPGVLEVSYTQVPFPAVPGGMVTNMVRVMAGAPASQTLFYANDQGWWMKAPDGAISALQDLQIIQEIFPVPSLDGSDRGAFHVNVQARAYGGLRYFDWAATPMSMCRIPVIYGGIGFVTNLIRFNGARFFDTLWNTELTGPGMDGWGVICRSAGATRNDLKVVTPAPNFAEPRTVEYTGRRFTMTDAAWGQICAQLQGMWREITFPWDAAWDWRIPGGPYYDPNYHDIWVG